MLSTPHKSEIAAPGWNTRHNWMWLSVLAGVLISLTLIFLWLRRDPESSFQRGLAAIEKRDIPALHRELQILRQYPKYGPQVQLLRGTVFLIGNNPQAALHEFDLCAIYPATRVYALTLAGEAFCRMDRPPAAIEVLQQALGFDAQFVPAHRCLAIAHYDSGSHDLAIAELRKVAELDPTDYRPHRLLGTIHKGDDRYAEAVQDYRASLRLAPQQPTRQAVLLELAQSLAKLGRYSEALEFLAKAQVSADIWACRAGCELNLGHKSLSRQAALKALEMAPNHLEALLWLGILEAADGRLVLAEQYLQRAIKTHPRDATARSQLAAIYQRQGKSAEAQAQLTLLATNKRLREKFTSLQQQLKARPQDASLRFELGETARELQLFRLARIWYQAALGLNPHHARAQQALSHLPPPRAASNFSESTPALSPQLP